MSDSNRAFTLLAYISVQTDFFFIRIQQSVSALFVSEIIVLYVFQIYFFFACAFGHSNYAWLNYQELFGFR